MIRLKNTEPVIIIIRILPFVHPYNTKCNINLPVSKTFYYQNTLLWVYLYTVF